MWKKKKNNPLNLEMAELMAMDMTEEEGEWVMDNAHLSSKEKKELGKYAEQQST